MNLMGRTKRRLRRGMVRFVIWLISEVRISAEELGFPQERKRRAEVSQWGRGRTRLAQGNNLITTTFGGRPVSLFVDQYRSSTSVLTLTLMARDPIDQYFLQGEVAGLARAITGEESQIIGNTILAFTPPELGLEGAAHYFRREFPRLVAIGERFMGMPWRVYRRFN